jgi:transposase
MPAPYALDLRKRVLEAYQAKEGSLRQLADRFKVSLSFVRDLTRRYRETGQVEPRPHGGGAPAKLTEVEIRVVEQLVTAQPDALLSELCERLTQKTEVTVSVPTMHRTVQRLGLSYKKKH